MKLNNDDFLGVIKNAPLFAIDLVVVNEKREILVGKRLNPPAKSWWFVPGGRVYKNEALHDAFKRIAIVELGLFCELDQEYSLGLFEHFYEDSALSDKVSTHYINAPYLVICNKTNISAPHTQHSEYRWISVEEVQKDASVHQYSKVFISALEEKLSGAGRAKGPL